MSIFAKPIKLYPFGVYINLPPLAPTGANWYPYAATIDDSIMLIQWIQAFFVAAPNDGANYWTFDIMIANPFGSIATFTTQGNGANAWVSNKVLTFIQTLLTPVETTMFIQCFSTGAPGVCYVAGPALQYL